MSSSKTPNLSRPCFARSEDNVSTDYMLDPPEYDPPCPNCDEPVAVDKGGNFLCENCGEAPKWEPDYEAMIDERGGYA